VYFDEIVLKTWEMVQGPVDLILVDLLMKSLGRCLCSPSASSCYCYLLCSLLLLCLKI